jgi:hypothetical protein
MARATRSGTSSSSPSNAWSSFFSPSSAIVFPAAKLRREIGGECLGLSHGYQRRSRVAGGAAAGEFLASTKGAGPGPPARPETAQHAHQCAPTRGTAQGFLYKKTGWQAALSSDARRQAAAYDAISA